MKLAFCPTCERVSYTGIYHSGICSYCGSKTVDVRVRSSPFYILGIAMVIVVSLGVYLYEPLQLLERAAIMIAALIGGYALVLKGLKNMRRKAWRAGKEAKQ